MTRRNVTRSILATAIVMATLSAGAQTSGTNASAPSTDAAKPAAASTAMAANPTQTSNAGSARRGNQHMASQKRHRAHHKTMAVSAPTHDRQVAYKAALRRCVERSTGQRDTCLDDAIMRFGRS